jgi:UDP-glucose 4-epimerase
MRILVTGGAGFIGSHVADAAVEAGHEVTVLDDLSTGRRENLNAEARFVEGDLRRDDDLARALADRPEAIFHLAAQIDVRKSVADPAWDADVNVAGTARLLEAARAHGGGHVIFSSTGGAIYGQTDRLPTPEDELPRPIAPYGTAKYCAEQYLWLFDRLHGLPVTALRYGNVYGPRQDPLGEAGVCAIFCQAKLDGARPTVFGTGRQTRDYVYVGDVVAANMAALERGGQGRPFNVGRGEEVSVLDLVEALELAEPVMAPARPGEADRSCLDPSAASADLGWQATVPLEDGLRRTLASM